MSKFLVKISGRFSIRTLLIFFTVALIFLIITVLTVFTILHSRKILQENSDREISLALKQSSDNLESFLELRKANLEVWGAQPIVEIFFSNPELRVLTEPGIQSFFSKIAAKDTWLESILLADQGKILYDRSNDKNAVENWFSSTAQTRQFLLNPDLPYFVHEFPFTSEGTKTILFIKRSFVKNNLAVPGKYLLAMIDLEALQDSLLHAVKIGANGFVFIFAQQQNEQLWIPKKIGDSPFMQEFAQVHPLWAPWQTSPLRTRSFSLKINHMSPYPLALAGVSSLNDIKTTLTSLVWTLISAGLLVLVFGICVTLVLSYTISRPLFELLTSVKHVELNKLRSIRKCSNVLFYTEIDILQKAFASMVDKLIGSKNELEKRNEELKILEQSLRMQRNYLHTTLSSIGEGVITTDQETNITFINPVAKQMLNCTEEQAVNTPLANLFIIADEKTRVRIENPVDKIIESGNILALTNSILLLTNDGREIPIDSCGAPIRDEDENLYGVVLVFRDVSIRRNAEKLRQANEERFRLLFENNPVSIWLKDLSGIKNLFDDLKKQGVGDIEDYMINHPDFLPQCIDLARIVDVNQTTLELYEAETKAIFFEGIKKGSPPESEAFFARELVDLWNGKNSIRMESIITTMTGKIRNVAINCNVVADYEDTFAQVLFSITDITEQKKLEERLYQAQKMETIGTLAGGVAHDYNNMLSVILGYSELALKKENMEASLRDNLVQIHNAAQRSTEITRQLLAFARKQNISPQILDFNSTLTSMMKMLRRLIGENIDLTWYPSPDALFVKMDPTQIDQLLVNLCVNARDAIIDVGKVTIETAFKTIEEAYCSVHSESFSGDFVMLAVSDNGTGMDRETAGKIFDPFFTTKKKGCGTGMGLATVYGIVKQNDGFINVYSEPGKGTTFKIFLPMVKDRSLDTNRQDSTNVPSSNGETVLLVEDDRPNLQLCIELLEYSGYTVLPADNPYDAINLAKENSDKINLLITDVVMPGMNGRQLSEQLRRIVPDLKILFMSGYTANIIAHRGVLDEGVCFLSKPFSMNDLALKIHEVLGYGEVRGG